MVSVLRASRNEFVQAEADARISHRLSGWILGGEECAGYAKRRWAFPDRTIKLDRVGKVGLANESPRSCDWRLDSSGPTVHKSLLLLPTDDDGDHRSEHEEADPRGGRSSGTRDKVIADVREEQIQGNLAPITEGGNRNTSRP
jgi:hypothetical protein